MLLVMLEHASGSRTDRVIVKRKVRHAQKSVQLEELEKIKGLQMRLLELVICCHM